MRLHPRSSATSRRELDSVTGEPPTRYPVVRELIHGSSIKSCRRATFDTNQSGGVKKTANMQTPGEMYRYCVAPPTRSRDMTSLIALSSNSTLSVTGSANAAVSLTYASFARNLSKPRPPLRAAIWSKHMAYQWQAVRRPLRMRTWTVGTCPTWTPLRTASSPSMKVAAANAFTWVSAVAAASLAR
jgi:hypothetical protein